MNTQTQKFGQTPPRQEENPETWNGYGQADKTLDSEMGASEHVNYHNQVKGVHESEVSKSDRTTLYS